MARRWNKAITAPSNSVPVGDINKDYDSVDKKPCVAPALCRSWWPGGWNKAITAPSNSVPVGDINKDHDGIYVGLFEMF